ncbi:MAG: hypothetical protein K8R18_03230 [Parvibaculum sp.]|uniref:hypothetical protein n=1 Tax=Parvibaculum sp. TaxID=2024848 RepID=UPI0025CD1520|nr:hypothetical protein [Parvibaculum sp.]MCE9648617.1 hypothetical protein [Parvibaculum sp.]
MKALSIAVLLLALAGCGNHQLLGDKRDYVKEGTPNPVASVTKAAKYPAHSHTIWITPSALPPDVEYEVLESIKIKPRSGGTVRKVEAKMADRARALGADMIIKEDIAYGHSMWMTAVPVGRGDAIKLKHPESFSPTSVPGAWY